MKTNKITVFSMLVMLLVAFVAGIGIADAAGTAPNIEVVSVKINGLDNIDDSDAVQTQYQRGEKLDIIVRLFANEDVSNVRVKVELEGDEHHTIVDQTEQFDASANTYHPKHLSISLPEDLEKDTYLLTIRVTSRGNPDVQRRFYINVDTKRHDIVINSIDFSSNPVKAGRGMEAMVRVKNVGQKDQDYVRIGFEIPKLGLKAADVYIDGLEAEKSRSSQPLYVRIPECAAEGVYDAIITVEFDNGYKQKTEVQEIAIVEGELCTATGVQKSTVILVGSDDQIVEKGKGGVVYPITISNNGLTSKSYLISTSGANEWAEIEMTPSNLVVVDAGKSEVVYVYVTAKDEAQTGQQVFTVNIKPNAGETEPIVLKATVAGKASGTAWERTKTALQIGLVVLLIALVVLAVIFAFDKMKKEKPEEESGAEGSADMGIETPVEDYSSGSYY